MSLNEFKNRNHKPYANIPLCKKNKIIIYLYDINRNKIYS